MKHVVLTSLLAAAVIIAFGCKQTESSRKPPQQAESVSNVGASSDKSAPLLLEDEPLLLPDEGTPADGPMADNSRCFVCHINYMQEDIAVIHAKANIGCAGCHGQSDNHIADESWASGGNGTAPDKMYPRPEINAFCMGCHKKEDIDAEQHKPLFAAKPSGKYCTDCHGTHRLVERKCKWK